MSRMQMNTLLRVALLGEALLPILLLACKQEAVADESVNKSSCVCASPAGLTIWLLLPAREAGSHSAVIRGSLRPCTI